MYPFEDDDYLVQFDNESPNRGGGRDRQPVMPGGFPGGMPGGMPGGFPSTVPGFPGGEPGGPGGFSGGRPGGFPSTAPGFPGGGPGRPGGFPGGGPGQLQAPTAPPPNFTPQMSTFEQQQFSRRGGVGGIRRCFFRNTFIWLKNGNAFWFFPMVAFRNQIIGFRWRGTRGWVYDSINRNNILFFQCY
ncbi:hypothetical protein [Lysinibacillus yapensis]|uniref:hypothetical protein n=1 Tax=Ureibacillus yapensis TaxID=2304605 RepID=UPI0018F7B57C|nr:hypothetical protein [Lysinibacillus yapensis]